MREQPRNIQLAWLAGIFDGEGCISIGNGKARPNAVMLRVVLRSRDKFVIELVQYIAGGRLQYRPVQKSWRPNCSDQWEWCLSRKAEVKVLLDELTPYLVLKKDKALEAIEVIS